MVRQCHYTCKYLSLGNVQFNIYFKLVLVNLSILTKDLHFNFTNNPIRVNGKRRGAVRRHFGVRRVDQFRLAFFFYDELVSRKIVDMCLVVTTCGNTIKPSSPPKFADSETEKLDFILQKYSKNVLTPLMSYHIHYSLYGRNIFGRNA